MATKLNPSKVEALFLDSLFKEEEDKTNFVKAEGIMNTIGFHPDRLELHRQEIEDMLLELPDEFKKSGGGGWSFLNACNDKEGNQWTDLHIIVDQLFTLGIAIGKVKFQLPREVWGVLPGGMPYLIIDI